MRALITGITGQDGLYLAELLSGKGYEVFGLVQPTHQDADSALSAAVPTATVLDGDLCDRDSLVQALAVAQPDEVYNLGAFSSVSRSWSSSELASDVTGMGALRLLEALRQHTDGDMSAVRLFQASSSEMFGAVRESPQTERTPFHPRSPYGVAKAFAHFMTVNFRESYGAFACCGILFNHESPRRGHEFVTRKITRGVAEISLGRQDEIALGNLEARRDWGFAGDYVEAMWLMLQQDAPDDYVIATGETHSIRDLLAAAFACVGIGDWERYVRQDPRFFRPAEVDLLVGDASKARTVLGWKPQVGFDELVRRMVEADLAELQAVDSAPARTQ